MSDRPLRVLHVGNIANNAYNNAKLLRAAGVECDVLCPLYYHSMACPEWEDADFAEAIDDYRPAWHEVDLGGFERPAWFVQGPTLLAVRYLLARRRGQRRRTAFYGRLLTVNLRLRAGWLGRLTETAREVIHRGGPVSLRHMFYLPHTRLGRHVLAAFARGGFFLAIGFILLGLSIVKALLSLWPRSEAAPETEQEGAFDRHIQKFRELFPERTDRLQPADLAVHLGDTQLCSELFDEYDIVQAYSTDPIYPLLAGYRPIVAFEHGTLRDIPWENSTRGRCTALSYAMADHVLVTNPDCQQAAERLNPGRVTFINHPWDEDHALGVEGAEELREQLLTELDADRLIFFPTRHDWVQGTGFADKANDRFFRALAGWTRRSGVRVGVVCCEWGGNVPESRALVETLGLAQHVRWSAPMGTVRFERFVLASDLVADQFEIAGMGGVAFKSLSAGRPVLMRIDEDVMREKYGDVPPALNCNTEDDIERALDTLAETRDVWQRRCDEARNWIKKHHSGAEVVEKQLSVYAELTDVRPGLEPLS